MSTALAIAGISQILRDLLNDGFIDHDLAEALGTNVTVFARPPDHAMTESDGDPALNIFLYHVAVSKAWSNQGLPTRDRTGRRVQNTPLALDLYYLISAYGSEDLHTDILLGHAMQILHEHPGIGRAEIQVALNPAPNLGTSLPPALRALSDTRLADQAEAIRITPHYLNPEEMSKIWTAMQSHYRPSMAYRVSTVLIEETLPERRALPVLTLGSDNAGAAVFPSVIPPRPTLMRVIPPARQQSVRQGDAFAVEGVNLDGITPEFRFDSPRLGAPIAVAPDAGGSASAQSVTVPNVPASWAAGTYLLTLSVTPFGGGSQAVSNAAPVQIAPVMSLPPASVVRGSDGAVTVTLGISPHLQPGQGAILTIGSVSSTLLPVATTTATLVFVFPELDAGTYPVWITVDGVDSWLTVRDRPPIGPDFVPRPPIFDATQSIVVPS